VLLNLSINYSALVFMAVVGVFQAAAAYNNLNGLLFFKQKWLTLTFAGLTAGSALAAFFTWNYRNPTGVIEGGQQVGLFATSTLLAVLAVMFISSVLQRGFLKGKAIHGEGLAIFRNATLFMVIQNKRNRKTE
jgi:ABC-type glycerol-3-phosphate transport system permease component